MNPKREKVSGSPLRKSGKAALGALLAFVLTAGGFALYLVFTSNLHVVSPGLVYRSCQPNSALMTKLVQENKLRTVINLRGANETSPWYQDEMRESERLGLKHFDFGLSANQEVSDEEIDRILETIRQAPKPVLIHCKSGADRTGLISALYLYREEQKSAESAAGELTIWGGHFPYLFWRKTGAMDVSFERYVRGHAQRPAPQPATGLIGSSR